VRQPGGGAARLRDAHRSTPTRPLDRAAALRLKQDAHLANGSSWRRRQAGLDRLGLFGIRLPLHPTWEDALAERERVRRLLRARPLEALVELPADARPRAGGGVGGRRRWPISIPTCSW
jgi:hypothetical protein